MQDKSDSKPPKAKLDPLDDEAILDLADEVLKESDDDVIELTDVMEDEDHFNDDVLDLTEVVGANEDQKGDIVDLTEVAEASLDSDEDILELEEIADESFDSDEPIVDLDDILEDEVDGEEEIVELDAFLSDNIEEEVTPSPTDTSELETPVALFSDEQTELSESDEPELDMESDIAESNIRLDFEEEEPPKPTITDALNSDTVDLTDIAPEDLDEELSLDFNLAEPTEATETAPSDAPSEDDLLAFDMDEAVLDAAGALSEEGSLPEETNAAQFDDTVDLTDLTPATLDDELKFNDQETDAAAAEHPVVSEPVEPLKFDTDEQGPADTIELDEPVTADASDAISDDDDIFTMDETLDLTDQDRQIIDQEFTLELDADESVDQEVSTDAETTDQFDVFDSETAGEELTAPTDAESSDDDLLSQPMDEAMVDDPLAALSDLDRLGEPLFTDTDQDFQDALSGVEPTADDETEPPIDEEIAEEPLAALDDLDRLDEPLVTDTDQEMPEPVFGTGPTVDDETEPPIDEEIVEEPLAALDDLDRLDEPLVTGIEKDIPETVFGAEPTVDDETEPPIDEEIAEEPLAALDDLDRLDEPLVTDTDQEISEPVFGTGPTADDEIVEEPAVLGDLDHPDEPLITDIDQGPLESAGEADPVPVVDEGSIEEPLASEGDFDDLDEPLVADTDLGLPDEEIVSDEEIDALSESSMLADTIEEPFEFTEADRNILTTDLDEPPEPVETVTDAALDADADQEAPTEDDSFPKADFLDTTEALNLDTEPDDEFIESLGMTIEAKGAAFDRLTEDTPDEIAKGVTPVEDQPDRFAPASEPASEIESPPEKTDELPQPTQAETITIDQLELALENVIKKMFSDKIETILHDVIEKTVTTEIDRLKKLLLEDSADDL